MSNAKVPYPDSEELEDFYRRMFRLSCERALNLSENLKEDEVMRDLHGDNVERVCGLLALISGVEYPSDKQSREGATYKSLAFVSHLYGLNDGERRLWYRAAEAIPLSQGHVSYLVNNVRGRNRLLEEAESLLGKGWKRAMLY
jgi:hypothetical protein